MGGNVVLGANRCYDGFLLFIRKSMLAPSSELARFIESRGSAHPMVIYPVS